MYKIYAVCAAGIGTSLFAKKLLNQAVSELGYDLSQFEINCTSAREAKTRTDVDVFVSGMSLDASVGDRPGVIKLRVGNMINDIEGMKNALGPVLEQAVADGKISK